MMNGWGRVREAAAEQEDVIIEETTEERMHCREQRTR